MALDLDEYQEWTLEMLYRMLFPYIREDFMGKRDCQAIHQDGNMLAGESTVIHLTTRGGSDSFISAKAEEYRADVEEGRVRLRQAQETGEF
jgi:hypothetical protein